MWFFKHKDESVVLTQGGIEVKEVLEQFEVVAGKWIKVGDKLLTQGEQFFAHETGLAGSVIMAKFPNHVVQKPQIVIEAGELDSATNQPIIS